MSKSSRAVPDAVETVTVIVNDILAHGLRQDTDMLLAGLLSSLRDGMEILASEVEDLESKQADTWDEGWKTRDARQSHREPYVNPYRETHGD